MALRRESNLGELDFQAIQKETEKQNLKRKPSYQKYKPEDRFKIGKYASENGPIAAVRKFRITYPSIQESTARGFRSKYEEELKKAKKESRSVSTALTEERRGRPLMLGSIDVMVQDYLKVFPFL